MNNILETTTANTTKQNIKGIKIQTFSRIVAIIGIILFFATLYNIFGFVSKYKLLVNSVDTYVESQEYLTNLQDASDYMTDSTRMYVLTQDSSYIKKYFEPVNNKKREKALENLKTTLINSKYDNSLAKVERALNESNALMDYELHAMKLISTMSYFSDEGIPQWVTEYKLPNEEQSLSDSEKLTVAYNLVFGKEYRKNKEAIDNDISTATEELLHELKSDAANSVDNMWTGINELVIKIFVMMLIMIIICIIIAFLVVKPLKVFENCIKENRAFDVVGAHEFKYLANTYNQMFELNQQNKEHMKFKLEHDALTNVYSRMAFEEQKETLSKENVPMTLLIVDVDCFKEINDTYGHKAGDATLVRVANTLRHSFRVDDMVARVGGDEFVAVLMNMGESELENIGSKLDKINHTLQNPKNGEIKTSLSIGIAFSESGYSEEMYAKADTALYETKENGRCGYRIYKPKDDIE